MLIMRIPGFSVPSLYKWRMPEDAELLGASCYTTFSMPWSFGITTSDFWDQEPCSISSPLHDERCRILWMRKCSHANWVMGGHGSHLQNTSLKKTEPTQVKIFQRAKAGLETQIIKTDNLAWHLQRDQIQHAQLPTRRYNECVHYQQFQWYLKQLSSVPSSKGPREGKFQSENTDQLKQKKVWSYKWMA